MSDVLPNLEAALVKYLRDEIGVQVGTRVPATRPASFIRLTRTGGAPLDRAQSRPTVLIECWGSDETAAWSLASKAWPLLAGHRDGIRMGAVEVTTASLTDPVNYPDSATGTPRYQFIYSPIVITEGASL